MNRSNPTQVHMVTWVGVGFDRELSKGHGKGISRSQQGQICSKRLEMAYFVCFSNNMFTWNVNDNLKQIPTRTYTKTPPRGFRDNV